MTDNEIIKDLERYISEITELGGESFSGTIFVKEILALINRQQAEIERSKKERDKEHDNCNHYARMCVKAKSEARKEFAEQLEAEIISSDKYIREYDDSEVQKAYNKGLRDALKILKEMGCDNA